VKLKVHFLNSFKLECNYEFWGVFPMFLKSLLDLIIRGELDIAVFKEVGMLHDSGPTI
jgi:hypothetical protein